MNEHGSKRFSIALSFPGERRGFVEKVADHLADAVSKERVLYDHYYKAEFARFDLNIYLPDLYSTQSELIVIFLCPEYEKKQWCKLELRHIRQLIATSDQDRIMLLSFKDPGDLTNLGILKGDGYLDIDSMPSDEVATHILERLSLSNPQSSTTTKIQNTNDGTKKLRQKFEQANVEERKGNFYGKHREKLLTFFTNDWLSNGPAVAVLQGFPGCGKTQLSRAVAEESQRRSICVQPQADAPNSSVELLVDLAEALSAKGIIDLKQEMSKGENGNLFKSLLGVLSREDVLITIDEFQILFSNTNTSPPRKWQRLVEELNNNPNVNGRLMLVSNRSIKPARWCESCTQHELGGLTDEEAAIFLLELIKMSDLTEKIPTERLKEIGYRLGGNPRALKTLVGSLRYDSLEDLISLAPDLFKSDDVKLDIDLVVEFERALIERALPEMDGDLIKFMRYMAVHRSPFKKEAFVEFKGTADSPSTLRKQLIDRFLFENSSGWDSLHPLAREISVSRLRLKKKEWRQAHSLAADYHFRHFKARQVTGTQKLTASYTELRYHLFEAGRIDELHLASKTLAKFALSQITKSMQSQVPNNVETLEERIALISALPDGHRPGGLECHLALCLKQRNTGDDYRRALDHVRSAAGPHSYYAVWLLLIELEYELNGTGAMLATQKRALEYLGGGKNSFSIYLQCAELLTKDSKLSDAIGVLEKGIYTQGVTCLSSLISRCATYMEQAEKFEDAIRILQKGIDTPDIPDLGLLYLHCANLLDRMKRSDEAIQLLEKGVKIHGITKCYSFYLTLAEYFVKEGRDEDAIRWLYSGLEDSRVFELNRIYCKCAELLVSNHRIDEAVDLLERGVVSKAVRDPVPLYHSFAIIMEESGNTPDAVKFLKKAISKPPMSLESSMYLTCAQLLFHSRQLDDAIGVLKQGVSNVKLKKKGLLYQKAAELIARQGRPDEAIELLEQGIFDKSEYCHYSLYQVCSDLMVKEGRYKDAIVLMRKGVNAPALANRAVLYQSLAKLLAKSGRTPEGICFLLEAMEIPGMTGMIVLYQTCAKLMSNVGRVDDAIELLKKTFCGPKMGNLVSLYQLCADLQSKSGHHGEAKILMEKALIEYPKDKSLRVFYGKLLAKGDGGVGAARAL